jgi:glycosylphosphatidylinositol transamidase (GPIT) subunit GPI8
MEDGRWKMWLCAAVFTFVCSLFSSCTQEDDTIVYMQSRRWVEKTVAVVAPMSADAATTARFERTAQWFVDNFHEAQLHDTLCIDLKLEWHDEQKEDLSRLGQELGEREDVMAVIGPFSNDGVALLAPGCQPMHKPVIAPTATSEEIVRRFAVGTAGVANKEPFLWSLTETDITFCEVLMNMYASFVKTLEAGPNTITPAALFTPNDSYGRTFYDWGPYQAEEMGIPVSHNEQYTSNEDLCKRMKAYYNELFTMPLPSYGNFYTGNFCVIETTQQLLDIARLRMEWWGRNPDEPMTGEDKDVTLLMLENWWRTWFAFSNLTQESLEALGPQALDVLQYYQGFSPYADPTTGFEMSYEVKFGNKPTFAECKFYDALMLAGFAASYYEHRAEVTDLNQAIIDITTPQAQQLKSAAWSQTSMELYLSALEQGQLMDFKGASGEIRFDNETYTSALHTTYVHWQIQDGKIQHRNYLSSDGSHRTSGTMAAWSWLVENAEEEFAKSAENKDAGIQYPELTDRYAVLVQGSNGWSNYRHQADVLNMYQLLRKNGYDDDHIILIIDKALATNEKNAEPGIIRAADNGPDLLAGAVIDYDNAALYPADICNILLGEPSATTPVVLPKDAGQNVLLFWSGHGHNKASNGADELAWCDAGNGQGMTATRLRQTVSQMQKGGHYRKMLILTEPCFSEVVITPLVGIPGVLAMSSAGRYEQSFADNWSSELGVWRCDRFSRNLVTHLSANPSTTYRDLYLYCAQHTLGSHVHIVNSANFGNLYTTTPQEFFEKR